MAENSNESRQKMVGTILREFDRQRDQEPIFQEVVFPRLGDIELDGWVPFEGVFNVFQLADAIIKEYDL